MTDINEMSFDELVPSKSKYLAKTDVPEEGVILTIRGFKREMVEGDDGNEEKTICYWREDGYKPMVVNRTNAGLIQIATGAKTAGESRGKQVVVYNDPTVGFGGKITGGLRIKKVMGQPKPAAAAGSSLDDDIPFLPCEYRSLA